MKRNKLYILILLILILTVILSYQLFLKKDTPTALNENESIETLSRTEDNKVKTDRLDNIDENDQITPSHDGIKQTQDDVIQPQEIIEDNSLPLQKPSDEVKQPVKTKGENKQSQQIEIEIIPSQNEQEQEFESDNTTYDEEQPNIKQSENKTPENERKELEVQDKNIESTENVNQLDNKTVLPGKKSKKEKVKSPQEELILEDTRATHKIGQKEFRDSKNVNDDDETKSFRETKVFEEKEIMTSFPDSEQKRNSDAENKIKEKKLPTAPKRNKKEHENNFKIKPPVRVAIFGTDKTDNNNARNDLIMLLKYSFHNNKLSLISIPADTIVHVPGKGKDKTNSIYEPGNTKLALITLEKLFNINLDYFAEINFSGFKDIVDSLGGVKVDIDKEFINKWGNKLNLEEGENTLNGDTALKYVRLKDNTTGEIARIKRQQQVFISLFNQLIDFESVFKINSLYKIASSNIHTDISWKETLNLAWEAKDFRKVSIVKYILKTKQHKENNNYYQQIDTESLKELSQILKEEYQDNRQ